jgi:hypothetical protein
VVEHGSEATVAGTLELDRTSPPAKTVQAPLKFSGWS